MPGFSCFCLAILYSESMRKRLANTPALTPTFAMIARAVVQTRSQYFPGRIAQRFRAAFHDPMALARAAYAYRRHLSLAYVPK